MRLVMNTVLPDRLSPVTASQTVAVPANSLRLLTRRSDACAKIGGNQLKFTMAVMGLRRALLPTHWHPTWARIRTCAWAKRGRWCGAQPMLRHARPQRARTALLCPVCLVRDA